MSGKTRTLEYTLIFWKDLNTFSDETVRQETKRLSRGRRVQHAGEVKCDDDAKSTKLATSHVFASIYRFPVAALTDNDSTVHSLGKLLEFA